MAMTLAAATLNTMIGDFTVEDAAAIVIKKLAIACPSAVMHHNGLFLPVDKETGCWLFVSNEGDIELGEAAA